MKQLNDQNNYYNYINHLIVEKKIFLKEYSQFFYHVLILTVI